MMFEQDSTKDTSYRRRAFGRMLQGGRLVRGFVAGANVLLGAVLWFLACTDFSFRGAIADIVFILGTAGDRHRSGGRARGAIRGFLRCRVQFRAPWRERARGS
jgi:hypothetical protein